MSRNINGIITSSDDALHLVYLRFFWVILGHGSKPKQEDIGIGR